MTQYHLNYAILLLSYFLQTKNEKKVVCIILCTLLINLRLNGDEVPLKNVAYRNGPKLKSQFHISNARCLKYVC